MRVGRRPGSLCVFKCCICGKSELTTGGNHAYRCMECRQRPPVADSDSPHYREMRSGRIEAALSVSRAIVDGKLPHPTAMTCTDCGAKASEYDHRDYSKPLAVDPVCRSCNRQRGHALPLAGYVSDCVRHGVIPYKLKVRVSRLFRWMGVDSEALASASPKLSLDDWRAIQSEVGHLPAAQRLFAVSAQAATEPERVA